MRISDIEQSVVSKGRLELLRHMAGERLTQREMILAKCFECNCGYLDGKRTCSMPTCPLYPLMPYKLLGEAPATPPEP